MTDIKNQNISTTMIGLNGGSAGNIVGGNSLDSLSSSNNTPNKINNDNLIDTPLIYLVETFYISSKKNTVFQVRLTNRGLTLRKESNGSTKEQTISLQDIVGSRCLRSKRKRTKGSACACTSLTGQTQLKVVEENSGEQDETDVSAYLYIYAYVLKKNRRGGGGKRERTSITLRFRSFDKYEDNNREAQKWRAKIKQLINDELPKSPSFQPADNRKVLVLLNPKSGSGKAREIFQQRVAPILVEAEVPYELHVTKRANFAREYVRMRDIYLYRSIVVLGGDGIYFEVINGIMERDDWEKAIYEVSIGIIPCGSGNGLAKSISYEFNEPYEPKPVLGAALASVRGRAHPIDLVRVETRSSIMFSFLSIGWGFISEVDIESERLRLIGGQRFTLWSLHRLISLRTYSGRLSFKPALNVQQNGTNYANGNNISKLKHSLSCNTTLDCPNCQGEGDCETCDTDFDDVLSLETTTGQDHFRTRLDSWYSATSRKSAYFSTTESIYQSVAEKNSLTDLNNLPHKVQMNGPASTIPAITAPVPEGWTTITDDFIMVHASYQSHLGAEAFIAPAAKLNDGIIWLIVIKAGAPRSQLLSFLLGLSNGTHLANANENIKMIPVTAFRLEPLGEQLGIMTVDGEKVESGSIQAEIFPGIGKVMVPIFQNNRNSRNSTMKS